MDFAPFLLRLVVRLGPREYGMEFLANSWNVWRRNFGRFQSQCVRHDFPLRSITCAIPAYGCLSFGVGCRSRAVPKALKSRGAKPVPAPGRPLEEDRVGMLREQLRDLPVVFRDGVMPGPRLLDEHLDGKPMRRDDRVAWVSGLAAAIAWS